MRKSVVFTLFMVGLFILPSIGLAWHNLAPIYSFTHIRTTEDDRYNFHSPGINYTYYGKKSKYKFFSSISFLFPLWADQNGESFYNPDFYTSTLGADLFLGVAREYRLSKRFRFVPALGAHLNGIRLRGEEIYKDFYSLTAGFGLTLHARYGNRTKLSASSFFSGSIDFIDLLYENNKLKNGYTLTTGIGLSF